MLVLRTRGEGSYPRGCAYGSDGLKEQEIYVNTELFHTIK